MPSPPPGIADSSCKGGRPAGELDASPAGLFRRASQAYEAKNYTQAIDLIDAAIAAEPGEANHWNAKGVFLRVMGRLPEAVACYHQALARSPNGSGIWSNLGNVLKDQKHFQSAIACHELAVALKTHDAGLLHNQGVTLAAAGRYAEAVTAFNRALLFKPGAVDILWDKALSALHQGDFATGWVDYEARLENGLLPKRKRPGHPWRGQRFAGQHLVITAEQGFGDAIWAARFLPAVKALGGTVTLECQPELMPLFGQLNAVDRFLSKGRALPEADWHISICSLPGLFTPDLASISGSPYLRAKPDPVARLSSLLGHPDGKKRVGVVWSGSVTFKGNADRATGLDRFLASFSLPGVQLYSLQKGQPAHALRSHPNAPIIDLGSHLDDFADAAAAVDAMDLIIMTDSALVHLAGAMGKPVWVLLGASPYWLWLTERADSPWYESVTLFRQRSPGDWTGPFDAAASKLLRHERP
jgi:tetratricopeptide (TPR) repeat protein